jgi:hypothetical protein
LLEAELDRPRKTKPRGAPKSTIDAQLREMIATGDWSRARAAHFVALYQLGHETVYGCSAAELQGQGKASVNARKGALSAAKRLLEQEFGGRAKELARFFDWVWKREKQREVWAKENGRERGRLTWQIMIAGRAILTDYRASKLRAVPAQARAR